VDKPLFLTGQAKIRFQKTPASDHLSTFHPSPRSKTGRIRETSGQIDGAKTSARSDALLTSAGFGVFKAELWSTDLLVFNQKARISESCLLWHSVECPVRIQAPGVRKPETVHEYGGCESDELNWPVLSNQKTRTAADSSMPVSLRG